MSKDGRKSILEKLALITVLSLGALAVWGFVAGIVMSVGVHEGRMSISEYVVVTRDGRVLIAEYHQDGNFTSYRTVEGQPVVEASDGQGNGGVYLGVRERGGEPTYLDWLRRIIGFCNSEIPPTFWYLVHDGQPQGHAYFVGFNFSTKQLSGYLGSSGFRMERLPTEEQFKLNADSVNYGNGGGIAGMIWNFGRQPNTYTTPDSWVVRLVSDGKLWIVDLNRRSVRAVEGLMEVKSIYPASEPAKDKSSDYKRRFVVRTPEKVHVLNVDNEIISSFVIPEELQAKTVELFNWWSSAPVFLRNEWRTNVTNLYWADPQGKITKTVEVKLPSNPPGSLAWRAWLSVFQMPSPVPLIDTLFIEQPKYLVLGDIYPNFASALWHVITEEWAAYAALLVLSGALAVWCYRRDRRYNESGSALWSILIVFFGPVVLAGYLLYRRWPVMERCAKCGKETRRDRDECLECGAEFPLPALKGIEVFA